MRCASYLLRVGVLVPTRTPEKNGLGAEGLNNPSTVPQLLHGSQMNFHNVVIVRWWHCDVLIV